MAEKLCTIIGTGPGVSMAVAQQFAQEGYALALVARSAEKLTGYVADFAKDNVEARGYAADAGNFDALRHAFASIADEMGQTQVLVYNAAAFTQGPPSELDAEAFVNHFRVNTAAPLLAAQQVIPYMKEAGQGTILFTGGGLALHPHPQYASLAAGKAALRNLTKSLHDELKEDGIHVATVTIAGFVQEGTFFDPSKIAQQYWALHTQPAGAWDWEYLYAQQ